MVLTSNQFMLMDKTHTSRRTTSNQYLMKHLYVVKSAKILNGEFEEALAGFTNASKRSIKSDQTFQIAMVIKQSEGKYLYIHGYKIKMENKIYKEILFIYLLIYYLLGQMSSWKFMVMRIRFCFQFKFKNWNLVASGSKHEYQHGGSSKLFYANGIDYVDLMSHQSILVVMEATSLLFMRKNQI